DGIARAVSVVDLANGHRLTIDLDFTPHRLIASPDGYVVAAADFSVGSVAFVELMRNRVASRLAGLSPIRDLIFGADGAFLYVVAERLDGIGVIDVARVASRSKKSPSPVCAPLRPPGSLVPRAAAWDTSRRRVARQSVWSI